MQERRFLSPVPQTRHGQPSRPTHHPPSLTQKVDVSGVTRRVFVDGGGYSGKVKSLGWTSGGYELFGTNP